MSPNVQIVWPSLETTTRYREDIAYCPTLRSFSLYVGLRESGDEIRLKVAIEGDF
ncbi:MAG: hypothetical protein ACFFEK_06520 [Candidatus Thorarchaeota archaeon]